MKNQPRAAADAVNKAIALSPAIGDFHALVARLMIQGGQRIEAMRAVQNALRHGCQHTHGWQDLAVCANLLHRHHDAAKAFGEALRRTPNDVTLLCNAASNARHLGQLKQARQWLQRAVKIQPGNARAWWMLAPLSKDKAALATELETQWQRSPSAPARTYLGFALTHLHDALQNSDKAWHWAEAANRLVRKQQKHDQARWLARRQAHWNRQKQRWKKPLQETLPQNSAPRPLFILGLPRAGSSLLESLLASHSQIKSLGELPEFPLVLAKNLKSPGPESEDTLEKIGTDYLAQVQAIHAPQTSWFIDKLPDNAQHLGYLLMSLPTARVVWIDKHPLDAAWGLYKHLFGPGHKGWCYHLPWLGEAIATHHHQCRHWHQSAPDQVLRIEYEALVSEPRETLQAIQQFLRLGDESDIMLANQGQAVTATASASQVREKIHTRAIGRWRNYAQELEPARLAMQAIKADLC